MIHRYLATGVGVLILRCSPLARWLAQRRGEPARSSCLVAAGHAGLGLPAGRVRRAHGDHEAVPGHRHAAPARRHGAAGAAVQCRRCATRRRAGGRGAVPCSRRRCAAGCWPVGALAAGCRSRSAAGSAPTTRCWPAREFPDLPGQLVAADGLRAGLRALARARPDGATASRIAFAALTAIHYAHRLDGLCRVRRARRCWPGGCAACAALRAAGALAGGAGAAGSSPPACRNVRARLAAGSPRVLHTGGAAALVVVLTWALCEQPAPRRAPCAPASRCAPCREHAGRMPGTPRMTGTPPCRPPPRQRRRAAPVLRADQAARGAADRVLRADRHGAGRARRARPGRRARWRAGLRRHLAGRRRGGGLQLPGREGHRRQDDAHRLAADRHAAS